MTRTQIRGALIVAAAIAVVPLAGCGSDSSDDAGSAAVSAGPSPVIDPGDGGDYHPDVDPTDFVAGIDNPYLPFTLGSHWTYQARTEDGLERIEVVVTDQHKRVVGIDAVVVHDTVTVDGELVEDTFDWYAQDRDGNVWYLGEDTHEYEDGKPINSAGAWQAGVDGALPGIVMPAEPEVGMAYRQEYYRGEAEDMGEIIRLGGTITVPVGRFTDLVVTRDWTPLEPDVVEEKTYARGVGLIAEAKGGERVGLIEYDVR
jgi:ABC-type Fe3+-hydroxamate transport system substrate-binding protein